MTFAIVVARFYAEIADRLVAGAQRAFAEGGAPPAEVHDVPGAFELPLASLYLARSGRYDGIAALGCVVRGETDHYDYVCAEASRGIAEVSLRTEVPVGFGLLTVENGEQAMARSGGGHRDQGYGAARAVLDLARLRREVAAEATPSRSG